MASSEVKSVGNFENKNMESASDLALYCDFSVWEGDSDLGDGLESDGRRVDKWFAQHMLDCSIQAFPIESWKRQFEFKQVNALPNSCHMPAFIIWFL